MNRTDAIRSFLKSVADNSRPMDQRTADAIKRGLLILYNNQTDSERIDRTTHNRNGRGFNGRDARFGTIMAERAKDGKPFTERMLRVSAKMIVKYSAQIADAAGAA